MLKLNSTLGEFSPAQSLFSTFPPSKVKNPAEKRSRWFKKQFGCVILKAKVPAGRGNRRARLRVPRGTNLSPGGRKARGKNCSDRKPEGRSGQNNLSSCVAALGKKVLIVDLDPQGNTTTGYGIPKRSVEAGTYEVLIGRATAAQAIRHTEYRTDVIGSNTRLAGASLEMIDLPGREGRLRKALAEVQKDYDFIFIDCPPSLDLLTLNGLSACDSVLIPVQCEYYALEGLSELISTLKTIRKKYNPYLDIEGVVFTMFSLRYNLTVQVVEQVQKYFGSKVYKTTIPRSIRISEAPSYGQPINFYEPKGKGSEAYMDLAIEFVKHNRPQEPKKSRAKAAPAAEPAKNALED